MTAKKAGIMFIVFTLIQLVCLTGVIINQNPIVDWCIRLSGNYDLCPDIDNGY